MAKATATVGHPKDGNRGRTVIPVSPTSPWHVVNSTVEIEQNSGNRIVNPGTVFDDDNITTVNTNGSATTIEVALNHTVGGATTQECVVNVFGVDSNGVFQVLPDSNGDIDVTLTIDNTNDVVTTVDNSLFTKMTTAKKFDLLGNRDYEVHVKDALDWTTSELGAVYAREY